MPVLRRPVHAAPARCRGALRSTKARPSGRGSVSGGQTGALPRPSGLTRARQGSPAPARLSATGLLTDPADERGQAEARLARAVMQDMHSNNFGAAGVRALLTSATLSRSALDDAAKVLQH